MGIWSSLHLTVGIYEDQRGTGYLQRKLCEMVIIILIRIKMKKKVKARCTPCSRFSSYFLHEDISCMTHPKLIKKELLIHLDVVFSLVSHRM